MGMDHLNMHDDILYVMRKDGHYDLLYKKDTAGLENIKVLMKSD
jgi:hypothetical protein